MRLFFAILKFSNVIVAVKHYQHHFRGENGERSTLWKFKVYFPPFNHNTALWRGNGITLCGYFKRLTE